MEKYRPKCSRNNINLLFKRQNENVRHVVKDGLDWTGLDWTGPGKRGLSPCFTNRVESSTSPTPA